jgi:hypothetical protein
MVKVDFKSLDSYRAKQGEFRIVDVPPLTYLMIDGHGDPNTAEYRGAIEALFPVAYALKFASKTSLGKDYVVMPLEALWWAQDMQSFTTERDKSRWDWTAMILVPEWTTQSALHTAVVAVGEKKDPPAGLHRIRLERLEEGLCVQTLHIGSYDDETETLARLHDEFIPGANLRMTGKHHEIYLSDARRVAPAKLRTILRQPVTTPA